MLNNQQHHVMLTYCVLVDSNQLPIDTEVQASPSMLFRQSNWWAGQRMTYLFH